MSAAPSRVRVLPHNLEAEQCLLGVCLPRPDATAAVFDDATPELFYLPAHRLICQVLLSLVADVAPVDLVAVTDRMTTLGTPSAFALGLVAEHGKGYAPPHLERIESAPDEICRWNSRKVRLSRWENFLSVGKCGATRGSLLCQMDASDVRKDSSIAAYVLKGLRGVDLSPLELEPRH